MRTGSIGTCAPLSVALAAGLLGDASNAHAQFVFQPVALPGRPAPGAPAGVTYSDFPGVPILGGAGHIGFGAFLAGPGVTPPTSSAVFAGPITSPALVARQGSAPPGAGAGVTYLSFGTPSLGDDGNVGFVADFAGPGITESNGSAIYAGLAGAPAIIARRGSAAPGTPAGTTYSSVSHPFLSDAGHVTYAAAVTGAGVNDSNNEVIYAGPVGAPALVAREGSVAPGLGAGVNYGLLFAPSINDSGHVGYNAVLTGSAVNSTNDRALFVGLAGTVAPVIREGQAAPGMASGVRVGPLGNGATLNDTRTVAFLAELSGTGITPSNDDVIYAGTPGSLAIVARAGDAALGAPAGVNYERFFNPPALNDAGDLAYLAQLNGTGVGETNDMALVAGPMASPRVVAREGDAAPGTSAGVRYLRFDDPALDGLGRAAFVAGLTGTGVTDANDQALFAFDPALGTLLLAREGGVINIGGADLRTIAPDGISFLAGRSDDDFGGFAEDGRLALSLRFTNGTSGVFTVAVPEPATAWLLALAAVAMLRCRARSR